MADHNIIASIPIYNARMFAKNLVASDIAKKYIYVMVFAYDATVGRKHSYQDQNAEYYSTNYYVYQK